MYASWIFHSNGIVQSRTLVPDFTLIIFKSTISPIKSKLFLNPLPKILLQIGKSLLKYILSNFLL